MDIDSHPITKDIAFKIKVQLNQGKITIPANIRKIYGIKKNEVFEMIGYKDYIILKPTGTTTFIDY